MNKIIAHLFAARDAAHLLYVKNESLDSHQSLGDLYESIPSLVVALAEESSGPSGVLCIPRVDSIFTDSDPVSFMNQFVDWIEKNRTDLGSLDPFIREEWDNILAIANRAKEQLEQHFEQI